MLSYMKILMVNKFHYIKGGSETYYFALKRLLESHGHKVIDFSMKDQKNFLSSYEEYFVDNIDYNRKQTLKNKVKLAFNIIYSFEAKKKFEKLIQDTKPDIIHLHIFQHQLSPSILDVAKKYKIPVVYTAHDLKMLCLNYKMMTHGRICEKCKGGHYIECLKNKCIKDSYFKSLVNVVEGYLHKWRKSYDAIDVVITPSEFYMRKFIEFGINPDRILHIANCLDSDKPQIQKNEMTEKYYLYFGRLSEEKGVLTLIKAFEHTDYPLYIVGTGPIKQEIEKYIEQNNLNNIRVLGFKNGQELSNIVGNAKAVILPSEWYENGPYSAIEALQLGRPIIGSDFGGIPELVDGNGMIFKSCNVGQLRECIDKIQNITDEEYQLYCANSTKIFNKFYLPELHYMKLICIYNRLINRA